MLDLMRKNAQSTVIYLIFGVLIVVFAFSFGPGSGSCASGPADFAAKVDGDVIRRQEFSLLYNRYLDQQRFLGLGGSGANDAQRSILRRQVIDQLIERKLLAHEAERRGLTVSDQELIRYLKERLQAPQDIKDYENWVSNNFRMTTKRFEEQLRGDLVADMLSRVIRDTVSISNAELQSEYFHEHDRAMISFVRIEPDPTDAQEPSTAAIDKVIAEEAEALKERFEQNKFQYSTPHQVAARQILKKLSRDASDAEVAEARNALMGLKRQIEGGADFAAVAKQHSEDPNSKDKGGDIGFVRRGEMAKALTDALFALAENDILKEPVRTPQGLHLLQATKVQAPTQKPFEEVQREVAVGLLKSRASEEAAQVRATELLAKLKSGKSLDALSWTVQERDEAKREAEDAGKSFHNDKALRYESSWIQKTDTLIPRLGEVPELHQAIFALSPEQPVAPEVYTVGRSRVVAVLKEREIPELSKFEESKESLREQAIAAKQSRVFRAWVGHLREQAQVVLNAELFPAES